MSNSEASTSNGEPTPDTPYAAPLSKRQRIAATAIGLSLTGGGVASIFLGKSQAGSVVLVLGGVAFLIVAVIGMSVHRVRLKDVELYFGIRRTQQISEVASRLPHVDALRLMQILSETKDGDPYADPLLLLIDSLLFEARVRDAVISALKEGEHAETHPEADIGEPLLHVSRPDGIRIGVFAMFAPSEAGSLTAEFDDEFVDVLPRTGSHAVILITCVRDRGYLAALSDKIQQEAGLPVAIEYWRPRGEGRSLRSSIDRLSEAARAARTVPRRWSHRVPGATEAWICGEFETATRRPHRGGAAESNHKNTPHLVWEKAKPRGGPRGP
ncbi:hypothetical protein ACH4U7_17060, partial [Streptomyces sp. NPDC020845]|uniref:hypothetical protein n=1 Tax=Streptomyces sp. NPDC020845 TaxID=3365096 RepID=UPI0037B01106